MSLRNGFGNDSHYVLLTHADETVTDISLPYYFIEKSRYAHTCYLSGETAKDLSMWKFGKDTLVDKNGSWSVTGHSISDTGWGYIQCSGDTSNWDFGSNDFTIDFWIYPTSAFGTSGVYGSNGVYKDKDNYFGFAYDNGSITPGTGLTFFVMESSLITLSLQTAVTFSTKIWHHIAITRHVDTFRLFFDGELVTSTTSASYVMPDWGSKGYSYLIGAAVGRVGAPPLTPVYSMSANYDEFRISKGICRWTSSFTLPNREF